MTVHETAKHGCKCTQVRDSRRNRRHDILSRTSTILGIMFVQYIRWIVDISVTLADMTMTLYLRYVVSPDQTLNSRHSVQL